MRGGEMQGSDRETRGRCLMPPAVEMQKQSQIQIRKKTDKVQKVSDQNGWNIYPDQNNQWCCCLVWSHKRLTFSDTSSVWIVEHLNLKIRQGSQLVLSQNLNQEWRLFGMGSNTKKGFAELWLGDKNHGGCSKNLEMSEREDIIIMILAHSTAETKVVGEEKRSRWSSWGDWSTSLNRHQKRTQRWNSGADWSTCLYRDEGE